MNGYSFLMIFLVLSDDPSSMRIMELRCFLGKVSRSFRMYFSSLKIGMIMR